MAIILLYLCEVYFQNITVYTCQIIFLSLFVLDCLNSDVVYKASVIFNKQKQAETQTQKTVDKCHHITCWLRSRQCLCHSQHQTQKQTHVWFHMEFCRVLVLNLQFAFLFRLSVWTATNTLIWMLEVDGRARCHGWWVIKREDQIVLSTFHFIKRVVGASRNLPTHGGWFKDNCRIPMRLGIAVKWCVYKSFSWKNMLFCASDLT